MLHINLLGTPEIYQDDQLVPRFRTRKAQALLIYLAATNRRWSRDSLATLFWPESDDTTARKNLRDILPSLRRQLGDYLLLDEESIGLGPASQYKCDVAKFTATLEGQLQHVESDTLAGALALYRGEFLEDYANSRISADFELWALRERERLQQLALAGFTVLCQRQQAAGKYEAALITNRRLLKLIPWDEATHRQQMLLLAQSGQQAAALAHYQACCQILADELDVEPDRETVALYEEIKAGRHWAKPTDSMADNAAVRSVAAAEVKAIAHNLPRQLTNLIGRTEEIALLQRLLTAEDAALLTLVGQGGVGKTRLALAVAQQLRSQAQEHFPDGIWFTPLTGIEPSATATEQIAGAIAQAMGLSLTGSEPLTKQLIRALESQQLLLLLDNFEHLGGEQAFLLEILQSAQRVKVLVTSREQLHLHAEFLYPVVGLPVPAADELQAEEASVLSRRDLLVRPRYPRPPVDLGQYASVQLFVSRVRQRHPEFRLTTQNQNDIGRLCQLMGGVPLGIELAAQLYVEQGATVFQQLIQEIEQLDPLEPVTTVDAVGFDHLQTAAIDLPVRQRSIRAIFLHSWHLLTAAEQQQLRYCAIFRGGFTREAILAISAGEGSTLLALVMKSLVRRDSHDRYDLHELIRQYVIDQFQQEPQLIDATAQKHAQYFTDLLAGQEEKLLQQPDFHQAIQIEIYNIRAAWAWHIDQFAFRELERCVVCLFIYLRYAGQVQEALTLATQAIPHLRTQAQEKQREPLCERLLGYLLIYATSAGIGAGLIEESEQWLQEAMQIGKTLGDPGLLGQIYTTLMIRSSLNLENHLLVENAEKAMHWVSRANTRHLQPVVMRVLGIGLAHQGKMEESFQIAAELQQLIQRRHYRCIEGEFFFLASTLYEIQRDWEAELRAAQEGQLICKEHHHRFGLDNLEGNMIWANLQLGNFAQVRELANGFGTRARRTGKQAELLYSLQSMAHAEIGLGNWQVGAAYLTEALQLALATNNLVRRIFIRHQLGTVSIYQAAYDQALLHFRDALQTAAQIAPLSELQAFAQAGLALTYLRQGKLMQALVEIEEVLKTEKTTTPDSPDYCFIGLAIYQVLSAHQDPRAKIILEQLYQNIQTEAAKIKNGAQRRTFLENIAEHREIITLWEVIQG